LGSDFLEIVLPARLGIVGVDSPRQSVMGPDILGSVVLGPFSVASAAQYSG